MDQVRFRFAEKKDVPLILQFIRALAVYEKMEDQVVAEEKILTDWLFQKETARVLFALEGEK